MPNNLTDEVFSEDETIRRRDAALLRALSTPHKKQSETRLGKHRKSVSQGQNASDASHQADAPASQEAPKPQA